MNTILEKLQALEDIAVHQTTAIEQLLKANKLLAERLTQLEDAYARVLLEG
jgi:hypothetical protein